MILDPYDISDEEIMRKEFDDYELPAHDKHSINEIRKKIDANGYNALEEIESHQEFLEDMCNRLRTILRNERSIGEANWELERQIDDIKALYFELERLKKTKVKKK
ncbi:hypothetical protein AYK26_05460 [Euryarchaeota archaeon SM23-78]|nr:MAG: hypothetical protein AYK26_05460 [Euryarchaeota archaeon SM23-78]MBW3001490.1 hypothetical protein [Candidatus Woesearchaeota archaeon]